MARRGSFGRQPRPAQSLTNTIVAIAREMQQQRDFNLMQAWQKGGNFEGQKATDELVLKHWQKRMGQVSKDDPMYDTYQNAYLEYQYAIEESKMTVAYAQEKISDTQAAQFYLNWAKKVPQNSEFWRILQRDAAQYMRAAKAKARANADKLREERYQKQMFNLREKYEAAGEYISDTLKALAQRGSRDGTIGQLIGGPGNTSADLTDFDAGDPSQMLALLGQIMVQGKPEVNDFTGFTTGYGASKPNPEVIMYDDLDRPITGVDIANKFKQLGGGTGQIDLKAVQEAIRNKKTGLKERIALAEKTGHASDVSALRKELTYTAELGRQINAWPVQQEYLELRQDFFNTVNNPRASAYDKATAIEEYRSQLSRLSRDKRIQTDDQFRNVLLGEATGRDGTVTAAESFTGLQDPGEGKDVARANFELDRATEQIKAVESGQAVWTTGEYDDNGLFNPSAGGSVIGAAMPGQISAASGGVQPRVMYVPDASGTPRRVTVMGQDVMTKALNPATGEQVAVEAKLPVAQVYIVNGERVYGFKVNGVDTFSKQPPWGEQARLVEGKGGFELDISAYVPKPGENINPATGFSLRPGTKGEQVLVMDTSKATYATEPEHMQQDPNTDFTSPALALLSDTAEGRRKLQQLVKDPDFRDLVDFDNRTAAGQRFDPATGTWVGGDPGAYDRNRAQSNMVTAAGRGMGGSWAQANSLWDRSSTGNGLTGETVTTGDIVKQSVLGIKPLATASLSDTQFASMVQPFQQGTLNLNRSGSPDDRDELARIRTQGSIRVPAAPGVKPVSPGVKPSTAKPTMPTPPTNVSTTVTPTWGTAQQNDKPDGTPQGVAGGTWNAYGGGGPGGSGV